VPRDWTVVGSVFVVLSYFTLYHNGTHAHTILSAVFHVNLG